MANNISQVQLENELQLLTGVMTNDISYMVYLVIKDGCYGKRPESNDISHFPSGKVVDLSVEEFDDWFNSL